MSKKRTNEDFIKIVKETGAREYLVLEEYNGANKQIMFKHLKCGFEYPATPNNFIRGTRCPNCFGNTKKTTEEFRKQLIEKFDYEYELIGEYLNAHTKVKIKHNFCGNIYDVDPNSILKGHRCPRCYNSTKVSIAEKTISYYLKKINIHFEENIRLDIIFGKDKHKFGKMDIDIYLPEQKIAIFYDGPYHNEKTEIDKELNRFLYENKILVIRFKDDKTVFINDDYSKEYFCNSKYSEDKDKMVKTVLSILSNNIGKCINVDINTKRDSQKIAELMHYQIANNSLAKARPDLLEYWDFDKNTLNPECVSASSETYAFWLCPKCKNGFYSRISNVSHGKLCPFCSSRKLLPGFNDLQTRYPEIAKMWDKKKNGKIKPNMIFPKSNNEYWWLCPKGHSFQTSPNKMISYTRNCKLCAKNSQKEVYQYDLNYTFIKKYRNLTEAADSINASTSAISACCNKNLDIKNKKRYSTSAGFIWSYSKIEKTKNKITKRKS